MVYAFYVFRITQFFISFYCFLFPYSCSNFLLQALFSPIQINGPIYFFLSIQFQHIKIGS